MTSKTLLRGRVLTFDRRPETDEDTTAYTYLTDGGILIGADGLVESVGDFDSIEASDATIVDHRPHLIVPGLIDPHLHFVQMQVVGSYAANLLEWLTNYTFVEEQKFADPFHAARIAASFFDELIRHGTTTAGAYCSVHPASAEAFFAEADERSMLMVGGKVMMDRNAPSALTDTPQSGYDESKALIEEWHNKGRCRYAITPRFAITSSDEQLEMAGALASEYPDCPIQTHLSENHGEIEFTRELYPRHEDYTSIYAHYGLLRPGALMGHAIHLSDRELGLLAETGAAAVSCPTSNLFLGSGLFDLDRTEGAGVLPAVATDIGGGTSYSMFETMDEFYKIQQLHANRLDPLLSFYLMTLGNARAMRLDAEIGRIAPGYAADLAVLNAAATPAMLLRMETVETLAEELFLLQTMGDDRAVAAVYVAGTERKSEISR
jgi:guanine deaminase